MFNETRIVSVDIVDGKLEVVSRRPTGISYINGDPMPDEIWKDIYVAQGDEIILKETVKGEVKPQRIIPEEIVFENNPVVKDNENILKETVKGEDKPRRIIPEEFVFENNPESDMNATFKKKNPIANQKVTCFKCNMEFDGVMGFVCTVPDCPMGCGPAWS